MLYVHFPSCHIVQCKWMLLMCFAQWNRTTKAPNNVVVAFDLVCCTESDVGRSKIYIWQDTVNYYVFLASYDAPKIIDN